MRRVTARAPAHLTAFFVPRPAETPAHAGATGGGLALTDGVTATVEPRETPESTDEPYRLTVNGTRATVPAVAGVLERFATPPARVEIESAVPIGAGFGVSGAASLAAGLAASVAFDRPRTTRDVVAAAHAAEVEAGTGLGDAVAAARGGVPLRLAAGDPTHGRLDGIGADPRIEYVSFGGLSTADVLAGETSWEPGATALERVRQTPTVRRLVAEGRRFTRAVGLATTETKTAVEAVEAAGGQASMAMLGQTVYALGTGLTDAGYDPTVCRIDHAGLRLVEA